MTTTPRLVKLTAFVTSVVLYKDVEGGDRWNSGDWDDDVFRVPRRLPPIQDTAETTEEEDALLVP
jgi:hypothetical protein